MGVWVGLAALQPLQSISGILQGLVLQLQESEASRLNLESRLFDLEGGLQKTRRAEAVVTLCSNLPKAHMWWAGKGYLSSSDFGFRNQVTDTTVLELRYVLKGLPEGSVCQVHNLGTEILELTDPYDAFCLVGGRRLHPQSSLSILKTSDYNEFCLTGGF